MSNVRLLRQVLIASDQPVGSGTALEVVNQFTDAPVSIYNAVNGSLISNVGRTVAGANGFIDVWVPEGYPYLVKAYLTNYASRVIAHAVDPAYTGLDKVDNTADADKPISTAQAAVNSQKISKSTFTAKGQLLSASASGVPFIINPGTEGQFLISNPNVEGGLAFATPNLSFFGLDNVDNTRDEDKPVSQAMAQVLQRKLSDSLFSAGKGTMLVGHANGAPYPFAAGTESYVLSSDPNVDAGLRWVSPADFIGDHGVTTFNGRHGVVILQRSDTSTDWQSSLDPSADYPVDYTGANDSTAGLQDAITDGGDVDPGVGVFYGRGRSIGNPTGVVKTGPLNVSARLSIVGNGPLGSSVWKMAHGTTADVSMVTLLPDAFQTTNIGAIPEFRNMVLFGDSGNATVVEHGVSAINNKDDPEHYEGPAPVLNNSKITKFTGSGLRVSRLNQVRGTHSKIISNTGYGMELDRTSDSKFLACGFGGNGAGQLLLDNCASPQFTNFDIWNPKNNSFTGKSFTGKYSIETYSIRNARWFQGEISGGILLQGPNSDVSDKTRFQTLGNAFVGINLKVSSSTLGGANEASYDAMVQNIGSMGTHFAIGNAGYGQGDPDETELAATPKYIWKFSVTSGGDYATEAGWITVTSFDMLHQNKAAGIQDNVVPFTRHWSNDPKRVIWRTHKPGDIVCRATAAQAINELPCNGATYNKADYPLLYLGMDNTRQLTDVATTFTVPNLTSPGAGVAWFITAW